MVELIGWLGSAALSICALPQAYRTYKTKNTDGISFAYLTLWLKGEIFTLFYILLNDIEHGTMQIPLYLNYALNLLLAVYLVAAKYRYDLKKSTY